MVAKRDPRVERACFEGERPPYLSAATVAVFRGGLKNGRSVTMAGTRLRLASTVHSTSILVPVSLCPASTEASATTFLRIGLQVVLVALPTCRPRV
jgi:hypothetical protein